MNLRAMLGAGLLLFAGGALATAVDVPGGATLALAGGQLDAGGGDVALAGTLQLGSGQLSDVGQFQVTGTGDAELDSGQVTLFGNWINAGTINAGTSQVAFVDGGAAVSAVMGATTFAAVSFVSATGKRYRFQSGTTQTVTGALTIAGTQAAPIQFDVTQAGSVANIDLVAGGSQNIVHVGVSDVHATGEHLAPTQHNEGGSGNATGWFAQVLPPYVAVPTLAQWALLIMALMLLVAGLAAGSTTGASTPSRRRHRLSRSN